MSNRKGNIALVYLALFSVAVLAAVMLIGFAFDAMRLWLVGKFFGVM